ncbi:MAG: endonuclease/exonuclease/phosphatase family protein [Marinilabiliaceae bacterium]
MQGTEIHKKIFRVLLLLLLVPLVLSCDPFRTKLEQDDVRYYAPSTEKQEPTETTGELKVMSWNLKFGGGRFDFFFDCHGERVIMDSAEVIPNLDSIASFLNKTKPHILFAQEIDINSKRSAFIDQVDWILKRTHFNYAVYAPQWRATHIPSDGLGRMNSGNAIFSTTPLQNAKRIQLPLIGEQNFLVRYFYLRRNLLEAQTITGKDTLHLLNTHLSAYSKDDTKKRQIDQVFHHLDSLDQLNRTFVTGGDFNALPPGTGKIRNFPDSACEGDAFEADDYSGEEDWMMPFYEQFHPAVPLQEYQADNEPHFTHSTSADHFWNRKLDYLFSNQPLVNGITYQSKEKGGFRTMHLSDHCAVGATKK